MALLTPMTLAEAQALGRRFGLRVAGVTAIARGSVNSNFALDLERGGRVFLRVCEESAKEAVERQNRLLAHLCARGVKTPLPLPLVDAPGAVAEHAGKPAVAFAFCEGEWVCQARVGPGHAHAIGEALARIHLAGDGYRDAPDNRFGPAALLARIAALNAGEHGPLSREIDQAVDRLLRALDDLAPKLASLEPITVVHGDLFRDNVLWHQRELAALLDFESASFGHPALDLAVAILAWCFGDRLDQDLTRALCRGYRAVRPLPPEEAAASFDQARLCCARFAVTRITDYELRPPGAVVYKDFRRFLARLDAVEALGRQGWRALAGGG